YLLSSDEIPETLSASGQIYALSGDITGDLTISGNDITVNLNERTITGRIIITSSQRILVYGGNVIAPAPADEPTAEAGVIAIDSVSSDIQIANCYISAADGTVAGVSGAYGVVFASAPNVKISECIIKAGKGGPVNGVSAGGIGISGSGNNFILENSQV